MQASQGTVASEDPVEVLLGEIAGETGAVVTFRVAVDPILSAEVSTVSNQGEVASAELAPLTTDDPSTPEAGDPTVTEVQITPEVSITGASVAEGDDAVFTVSLSRASNRDATVSYAMSDGTAMAGDDYTAASGEVTVPAGATSAEIAVPILDDILDEPDETFTLTLSAPENAVLVDVEAVGTITDDDAPPSLTIGDVTVIEGDVEAVFPLALSTPSGFDITVDFATVDATAIAGGDFAAAGQVIFPAGTVEAAPSRSSTISRWSSTRPSPCACRFRST